LIYRAPPGGFASWREHGLVECLAGEGAYTVGFGVHPVTDRLFEWVGEDEPQNLPTDRLPVVGDDVLTAFRSPALSTLVTPVSAAPPSASTA
jgi:hypothetical protein